MLLTFMLLLINRFTCTIDISGVDQSRSTPDIIIIIIIMHNMLHMYIIVSMLVLSVGDYE